jgi:hypothetical protein
MRIIQRVRDWLLRRKQSRAWDEWWEEWAASVRSQGRNPAHDFLWPDCNRPLPHEHPLLRYGSQDWHD